MKYTIKDLKDYMREGDLSYDPWGTAISMAFDLSNELANRGDDVPQCFEFRTGAGGCYPVDEYSFDEIPEFPTSVLQEMGELLHRYLELCVYHEMDY